MPKLIVEDVPADVYERLKQRAEAEQRSVPEETVRLLDQALRASPSPRLPDLIPSEEIPAPCDLPRSSQPKQVTAYKGAPRLPDPLED
ncbi:MAG TPA: hypothetical protein VGZ47_14775 [Gemmataceae bacterium]|jgi:plasmid stability protein|nr:hypothetical protein [Gemmataceae bacterium]